MNLKLYIDNLIFLHPTYILAASDVNCVTVPNSQAKIAVNEESDSFEDATSQPETNVCDVNAVESLTETSYASAVNTEAEVNSSRSELENFNNMTCKKKKKTRSESILPQNESELNNYSDLKRTREVRFERPLPKIQHRRRLSCPELTKSKLELCSSEVKIPDSQTLYSTKKIHRAVNSLEGNSRTSSNSLYSDEYRSMSNYSTQTCSALFTDSNSFQTPSKNHSDQMLIRKLEAENRILKKALDDSLKNSTEIIEQYEDLMLRKKKNRQQIADRNKRISKLEKSNKKLKRDYTEKTSYRYQETYRYIEI